MFCNAWSPWAKGATLAAAATRSETREHFILFLFLLKRSLLFDSVHGVNVEEIHLNFNRSKMKTYYLIEEI